MYGNSREDKIYLGALFDGEGSIMVRRDASPSFMKNRIYPHYGIVIRIGMIDKTSIELYRKILGYGEFYEEKPYHHKRPIFRWTVRRVDEVKRFLDDMKEFIWLKKPQLILAKQFMEECSGKLGRKITPEMTKKQHEYYVAMRTLNGIESPATTERTGHKGRSKGFRVQATV